MRNRVSSIWLPMLTAALALLAGCRSPRVAAASDSVTTLTVTDRVVLPGVTRLGINLGDQNFYDSGQMLKNLIARNPGFEGMEYRSIFHCVTGGESRCVDTRGGIRFPDGFWDGAAYEVLDGAAAGRKGSLIVAVAEQAGYSLHLDSRKTPIGAGDWIALMKRFPGEPTAGWWPTTNGGGQLLAERDDLPPGTPGKQALRMDAPRASDLAQVNSYFDSTAGMTFVHLRGTYRLSFSARALRPGTVLHVHVGRTSAGMRRYVDADIRLTGAWATYHEDFAANEQNQPPAAVEVGFSISGGAALLDDASLEQTDGDPSNKTAFRDQVVDTIKQLHPGVLRMMASGAGLGSSINNLLAPTPARQRSGYRNWYERQDDVPVGLGEFLELCREVNAEPWIVVPTAMSLNETREIAEYLAGSAGTAGGALRQASGRAEPWTSAFGHIHIELGNETWNQIFAGESMEDPVAYGRRANAVFTAFGAAAGAQAPKFDLVVGSFAANPSRNSALLAAAPAANTLAIAPYLMMSVNEWATDDQLYGALLAQPEQMSRTGTVAQTQASAHGRQLGVYEVNLHTTEGAIPQDVLDRFTPSAAAGIAVAGHMLRMMRDHSVRDQMLFSLPQYSFKRQDGKTVRLWGGVVTMGERNRPQLIAASLANLAIGGDMVAVELSGDNPAHHQPAGNDGVQLPDAHEIDAYAFRDGTNRALIVFNYGLRSSRRIRLQAGGVSAGNRLRMTRMVNVAPGSTNEQTINVTVHAETTSASEFSLPPCSITVLQWTDAAR